MSEKTGRWAGRNSDKDAVRGAVWDALDDGGMAMGPTWSHIPNFIGADMAAWRLAQTDAWKRAKVVKCNPDPPQIPVRRVLALRMTFRLLTGSACLST